ncbi:TraB/GumN family protein [Halomicrobium sp. LC1Hm]|uniref:TraB/GumN family protein n=1 Tax=Halomicrobium sp. LC1Hm TaxID=2610902 RepID=UPI0012983624|nr:TraB/GumN family protein [Halomicrobium sp. LC1Hm]
MTDRAETTRNLPQGGGGEGRVTVVGTAHVSQDSVEEVERTIEDEQPDVVAVELDEGRYRQMKGETPEDLDASDLLRGNTVFQFLAYWMLSYVQTRLGDRFDVSPGADMMAAVETAERNGLGVALVDRDIQMTVQRFWARLSFWEKLSLVGALFAGMGDSRTVGLSIGLTIGVLVSVVVESTIGPLVVPAGNWLGGSLPLVGGLGGLGVAVADGLVVALGVALVVGIPVLALLTRASGGEEYEEFDPAELTDVDVVTAMMEEFRQFSPGGAEALIDERDAYIAHNLVDLRDAGYHVVAIVGAGHRAGIERYLDHPEELPPESSLVGRETGGWFSPYKLFGYLFTLGFLVFFLLLAMAVYTGVPGASSEFLLTLFGTWFLVNGIVAAALARLAGAHWSSSAVGGAVAWLTSVNPLLAPGWFAGYIELRYVDVNVGDIGTLNEILDDEQAPLSDIFQRLRAVPLFRLILIVAMTNVGSMIASALFATTLLPIIAAGAPNVNGVDGVVRLMIQGAQNSADLLWGLVR